MITKVRTLVHSLACFVPPIPIPITVPISFVRSFIQFKLTSPSCPRPAPSYTNTRCPHLVARLNTIGVDAIPYSLYQIKVSLSIHAQTCTHSLTFVHTASWIRRCRVPFRHCPVPVPVRVPRLGEFYPLASHTTSSLVPHSHSR